MCAYGVGGVGGGGGGGKEGEGEGMEVGKIIEHSKTWFNTHLGGRGGGYGPLSASYKLLHLGCN